MGGYGSGKWARLNAKEKTSRFQQLHIRTLKKSLHLTTESRVDVSWVHDGSLVSSPLHITKTPCHYGGERSWFLCPQCGRRVAILYGMFQQLCCRRCATLTYESQNESESDRLLRKARKIRRRLGGSDNMFEEFPPRPRFMRERVYARLRQKAREAWVVSLTKMLG